MHYTKKTCAKKPWKQSKKRSNKSSGESSSIDVKSNSEDEYCYLSSKSVEKKRPTKETETNQNLDLEKNLDYETKRKKQLQKKEKKLRGLLSKLAEDTSLHGFKQIHDNKGARKYIWLIALILAVCLVSVLFRTTVADYLNYKTYIETESDTDVKSIPFPTVTLCFNDNYLDFKFDNFPDPNVTFKQYQRIFSIIHMDKVPTEEDAALLERVNVSNFEQLIRSYHLTLEDTVLHDTTLIMNMGGHCSFSKQDCTIADLKLVWQIYGRRSCLQFNSYHPDKKPREQTVIYSPFRIYIDQRAKFSKALFAPGVKRYRRITLYIHPWGTPHEMYLGKDTR